MQLYDLLKIEKGITAVIGSGGKTTLLHVLAKELQGTVIMITTTLMYPSKTFKTLISPSEEVVVEALKQHRVLCIGKPAKNGKIACPEILPIALAGVADFVLVEADGAKQLPIKAHATHEPVIPKGANQTICVVGAAGFGKPMGQVVHRPKIFARFSGTTVDANVTPQMVAEVIKEEGFADRVFVNQVETKAEQEMARKFTQSLRIPVACGSLQRQNYSTLGYEKWE